MGIEHEDRELLKALRNGQPPSERSKEYWSEEEREEVKRRFLAGEGISQIAIALQRSENAVIQQLIAMGLLTPPGKHRNRKPKNLRCQCPSARENGCKYYERGKCKCCSNNMTRF